MLYTRIGYKTQDTCVLPYILFCFGSKTKSTNMPPRRKKQNKKRKPHTSTARTSNAQQRNHSVSKSRISGQQKHIEQQNEILQKFVKEKSFRTAINVAISIFTYSLTIPAVQRYISKVLHFQLDQERTRALPATLPRNPPSQKNTSPGASSDATKR